MAYGENFLFARPSPPLRSPFFFFLAYLRRAPVGRPCSSVHPPLSLPYAARRTGAHLGVRKGYSPTVMDRTDRAGKKEKHIGARRNLVSAPLAENINSPIQNITHPPPLFFFSLLPFRLAAAAAVESAAAAAAADAAALSARHPRPAYRLPTQVRR